MKYQIFFVSLAIIVQTQVTVAIRRHKTNSGYPPAPPGVLEPSTEFEEKPCGVRKPAPDLKAEFINKFPAWYVPIASKFFYRSWAEALLNRTIVASEISNLCMKWLFLSPTRPKGKYNIIVGGFGVAVTQYCMDTGFETETCEAPLNSPEHHKTADNVGTIVATDNERWFLLYRCVRGKLRDWGVFFTDRKSHDPEVFQKVASVVIDLGFDIKKVEYAKYDSCPAEKS